MFCVNCGERLEEGALFCVSCGARIDSELIDVPEVERVEAAQIDSPQVTSIQEEPAEDVRLEAPAASGSIWPDDPELNETKYEEPVYEAPEPEPEYVAPAYMPPQQARPYSEEPAYRRQGIDRDPAYRTQEPEPTYDRSYRPMIDPVPGTSRGKKGNKSMALIIILLVVALAMLGVLAGIIISGTRNSSSNSGDIDIAQIENQENSGDSGDTASDSEAAKKEEEEKPKKEEEEAKKKEEEAKKKEEEEKKKKEEEEKEKNWSQGSSASSVLPDESGFTYGPGNVYDGNLNTAWSEGVDGSAVGEWLEVSYDEEITGALRIYNGYQKSSERYYQNSRVCDAEVEFDTGQRYRFTLSDVYGQGQIVVFPNLEKTNKFRLTILSTYEGNQWDDVNISEIEIFDVKYIGGSPEAKIYATEVG